MLRQTIELLLVDRQMWQNKMSYIIWLLSEWRYVSFSLNIKSQENSIVSPGTNCIVFFLLQAQEGGVVCGGAEG